jgi:hypothetical protein
LIALPSCTYTCTEHHDVHPWQVVGFHSPLPEEAAVPEAARAFNAGLNMDPAAMAAPVATAALTKALRVISLSAMLMLDSPSAVSVVERNRP